LKTTLSEEIRKNLLWDGLKLQNKSYIDKSLKETFSDVVYSCDYQISVETIPLKITFLFEHKSQYAENIDLQLLRYRVNIWQKAHDQKTKKTKFRPIVIPSVFYHGQEKWIKRKFSKYFHPRPEEIPELLPFIPEFDYLLTDLSAYSNEEIRDHLFERAIMKTVALLMKNIYDGLPSARI